MRLLTFDNRETRNVVTERNVQDEPAFLAVGLIMLPQPPADFARLNADQRILAGIEGWPFSEGLGRDEELVNLVSPVLEVVVADQFQESLQFRSAAELRGQQDSLDFRFPFLNGCFSNTSSPITSSC